MSLLAAKLVLTPLVMFAASWASRRWGDAIGGWLVGLPIVSGPTAVFLAIERGPDFAASASVGSIAGVAAQACFCLGYAATAAWGWGLAFMAGAAAYVASAALWRALEWNMIAMMAAATALLAVTRTLLRAPIECAPPPRGLNWEAPLRMFVVTAIVVGVTSLAPLLGPRVSGMAASFPWIGAGLAAFAHRERGAAAGVAALRGMALALFAFVAFFVTVDATIGKAQLTLVFLGAVIVALAVQAATLLWVRGDARRVT